MEFDARQFKTFGYNYRGSKRLGNSIFEIRNITDFKFLVATLCDCSDRTVARWLQGTSTPNYENWKKLEEFFENRFEKKGRKKGDEVMEDMFCNNLVQEEVFKMHIEIMDYFCKAQIDACTLSELIEYIEKRRILLPTKIYDEVYGFLTVKMRSLVEKFEVEVLEKYQNNEFSELIENPLFNQEICNYILEFNGMQTTYEEMAEEIIRPIIRK